MSRKPFLYCGVFLLSAASLIFEIALTRLFSVMLWYHFTFMIVSFAMLGYGASGSVLSLFPGLLKREPESICSRLCLYFALSSLLVVAIACSIALDPFDLIKTPVQLVYLTIYYLILVLPFLFAGVCIGCLLSRNAAEANPLYGANLLGSGLGCIAAVHAIPIFSNIGTILLAAAIALVASAIFAGRSRKPAALMIMVFSMLIAAIAPMSPKLFQPRITNSKGMSRVLYASRLAPEMTRWNSFSQVDIFGQNARLLYAPGLSARYTIKERIEQKSIFIDADAGTPITRYGPAKDKLTFLEYLPSSVVYQLHAPKRACVIGAGGGIDVLTALWNSPGSQVTAVEINPDIAHAVADNYAGFSGNIYHRPQVRLVVDDGRHFMASSDERYDSIQLSLVDTWAASAAGAYSLTENYLYTVEAFQDYLSHLNSDGILTLTRWMTSPPNEVLRLEAIAWQALQDQGIQHPEQHIALIQSANVASLLVKKAAFQEADLSKLKRICKRRGFDILFMPGMHAGASLFSLILTGDPRVFNAYTFHVESVDDNQPFFFHFFRWRQLNPAVFWKVLSIDRNSVSFLVLIAALVQTGFLSGLLIFLPLWTSSGKNLRAARGKAALFGYFAALGIGFMFIEISLVQKLILFLGSPTRSLSVVLFSMLAFAGLGSFAAGRFKFTPQSALNIILPALSGTIIAYAFALTKLPYILQVLPNGLRVISAVSLLGPLTFLMGMPFPLAFKWISSRNPPLGPWAWGINGFASVVASVLSIILAIHAGFTAVLGCATAAYLIAWLLIRKVTLLL